MKIRILQHFLVASFALLLFCVGEVGAANFTVATSASPRIAGTTSGGGSFPSGSTITLTATPTNDCYQFVEWTSGGAKVSADDSITITTKGANQSFVAVFALDQYTVSTSSFPPKAGTTTGGGKKGCGTEAVLTAHANPGFAFVNWTEAGDTNVSIPTATCKVPVNDNMSFVANFRDTRPPLLKIFAPTKGESVPSSVFAIQGSAVDNVGVAAVYYNLNGSGWAPATTDNGYTNWYAWVTLKPAGANTLSVYAEDTAGNKTTNTVNFMSSAPGLAPLTIAENWAEVTLGTNTQPSFLVSFDLAGYVLVSPGTNQSGEVGTYTFTPTGPDTAELIPSQIFPAPQAANSGTALELTFSDGYTASFTNSDGTYGTFSFSPAPEIAPNSLDGAVVVGTSYVHPDFHSTNIFGASTYTNELSGQPTTSGIYTYTRFTPIAGLIVEIPTNPPIAAGTTDYIMISFTSGAAPLTGNYNYQPPGGDGSDAGSFVLTTGATDNTTYLGPVTLSGLQFQITPAGGPSFTRTYGNGTYASLSLKSFNEPTDVGVYLANPRVAADSGTDSFMAVAPPYAVGLDDETIDVTFGAKQSYTYSVPGTSAHGSAVSSKAPNTAAAGVAGFALTLTPNGKTKSAVINHVFNTFTTVNDGDDAGTYTYAPYTSCMALVTATFTAGVDAGKTAYVFLNFLTTSGGQYVYAEPNSSLAGGWEFSPGHFTLTAMKK